MSLGQRHGIVLEDRERDYRPHELVTGTGRDGAVRQARIAHLLFTKDCLHDFH